ncbi:MAG TPA: HRDC domain-containing protein [Gemmatimonadales bacterium]
MSAAPQASPRPSPPIRLIQSQAELERLFERLRGEQILAVDTEAASFHRYRDRIYLLQLSTRSETAVVDPLAVSSLAPLAAMLTDPQVEIVFHDADYDLRLLDLEHGFRANNLFDTRIAAQLLNEPGVGLAALLEKYFNVRLDKRYQRADWSARPLSREMLEYAAADTRHLLELRDLLRDQLRAKGRLGWAEEEFELLREVRWTVPSSEEPGFLRMKGAKALPGRGLAVLRELFLWREETARRADKAAFRILNNEPMLAMAQQPPPDLAALKAVRGVGQDQAERRGREILAAVQRGLDVPEGELPRFERPRRRPHDPAYEARLERLKVERNQLAARYELAPGVLCPNGTLEAIARLAPATVDELAGIAELRRWQLREIGTRLLEALQRPAPQATS